MQNNPLQINSEWLKMNGPRKRANANPALDNSDLDAGGLKMPENTGRLPQNDSASNLEVDSAKWVDAMAFKRGLVAKGWKTPDTYDNCYADPIHGPAVYLFLSYGSDPRDGFADYFRAVVAYVGMSTRLCQRWRTHSVLREIEECSQYRQRWFKPTPRAMLRDEELRLIRDYDPPWNIQGRKRGVVLI